MKCLPWPARTHDGKSLGDVQRSRIPWERYVALPDKCCYEGGQRSLADSIVAKDGVSASCVSHPRATRDTAFTSFRYGISSKLSIGSHSPSRQLE